MTFFSSSSNRQQADSVVMEALAVMRAIHKHVDICKSKNCRFCGIIKQIGLEAAQSPKARVVSSAPFRHLRDDNLNDLP
jgi:hypothetical protein